MDNIECEKERKKKGERGKIKGKKEKKKIPTGRKEKGERENEGRMG